MGAGPAAVPACVDQPPGGRTGLILASLVRGTDLLAGVLEVAAEAGTDTCWVQGIGALEIASVAWYDQAAGEYLETRLGGGLEILSLAGNVSMREGAAFAHVHLTLSGRDGAALGGHALPGCRVFACELALWPSPATVVRSPDEGTGLWLWPPGPQTQTS